MADDLLDNIRHALGLDVMWQKTVVTNPSEEDRIAKGLDSLPGLRILAHPVVDPGTIYVLNDEVMDEFYNKEMKFYFHFDPARHLLQEEIDDVRVKVIADAIREETVDTIRRGALKITNITSV